MRERRRRHGVRMKLIDVDDGRRALPREKSLGAFWDDHVSERAAQGS